MDYIPLSITDVAIAGGLLCVDGALSLALHLGLARRLLIAGTRMVIQLWLMALVLQTLFQWQSAGWTLLAAVVMIAFAGREITARQERPLAGWWSWGLGGASMFVAALTVSLFALTTQIRPDPWWDPRYALPLLGMVLGNTMTGVSLGLHLLTSQAHRDRAAIEARLALGQSRWQACHGVMRSAVRGGVVSILNIMSGAGLISIPGMMTGQILGGVPPAEAARYQMLIIFLIAGGTGIGAFVAVLSGVWRLTDSRHRLRLDRLAAKRS